MSSTLPGPLGYLVRTSSSAKHSSRVDIAAITRIELAWQRVELIAHRQEFKRQEEAWSNEIASLQVSHEAINEEIKKAIFELNANQFTTDRTRQIVAKAQAILEVSQLKEEEVSRRQDVLILHHGQLHQEVNICTIIIEEAKAQALQQLTMNEDKLHHQVLTSMERTCQ